MKEKIVFLQDQLNTLKYEEYINKKLNKMFEDDDK